MEEKHVIEELRNIWSKGSVDAFSDEVSLFATVGITGNGSNMGELLTLNPDTIDGQAYGGIRLVPRWAR